VSVHETSTAKGLLPLEQLREAAASGAIETVVVGFTDHYGRLMGKRYDAELRLQPLRADAASERRRHCAHRTDHSGD
jgi:hypothetical protein